MKYLSLLISTSLLSLPALSNGLLEEDAKIQPHGITQEEQRQDEATENLLKENVGSQNLGTGTGYGYDPGPHYGIDKKERMNDKKNKSLEK